MGGSTGSTDVNQSGVTTPQLINSANGSNANAGAVEANGSNTTLTTSDGGDVRQLNGSRLNPSEAVVLPSESLDGAAASNQNGGSNPTPGGEIPSPDGKQSPGRTG